MECMNDDKTIKVIKRVPILDAYMVNISFSPDGKYFALFRLKRNILQIYKIDNEDVLGLLSKVEMQDCHKEFKRIAALKNSQKMYFDLESRYLATYGQDTLNIISLIYSKDLMVKSEIIDKEEFEAIIDIQLVSKPDKSYRCDLACL